MSEGKLCPSAPCKPGAILLGIVQAEGRVAFLPTAMKVDAQFVRTANEGRAPEKRFRFANACVESGCCQWTGESCGLVDRVVAFADSEGVERLLPECRIRAQCRWYAQRGAEACGVCPYVITDAGVAAG